MDGLADDDDDDDGHKDVGMIQDVLSLDTIADNNPILLDEALDTGYGITFMQKFISSKFRVQWSLQIAECACEGFPKKI